MFSAEGLEFLVCPACRGSFAWDYEESELLCCECGLAYPVVDDIPILIVESARAT